MNDRKMKHKPYAKFKGALRERGLTYEDVARALNISTTGVALKVNGQSDFYANEVNLLCSKFNIDSSIFSFEGCECDNL